MEYALYAMLLCVGFYIFIDVVISFRQQSLSFSSYFWLGGGLRKAIILFFMGFTILFFALEPRTSIQHLPGNSNLDVHIEQEEVNKKLEELIEINKSIEESTEQISGNNSEFALWILIIFSFLIVLLIFIHTKYKDPSYRGQIVRAGSVLIGTGAIAITFTLITIENLNPELVWSKNENFYFELEENETTNPKSESLAVIPSKIKFIGSVEPFQEAKDQIEKVNVNGIEVDSDMLIQSQIQKLMGNTVRDEMIIENIILIGIADKNPLSKHAQNKWRNNAELALARAKKVEGMVYKVISKPEFNRHENVNVKVLTYGPKNTDHGVDEDKLAKDRRVDIYIGFRRLKAPI